VALDSKALIRSVTELDIPSAQVVTQPQHLAGARRQRKELLIREEWSDGQCKRAAEKVCPGELVELRHSSAEQPRLDSFTRLQGSGVKRSGLREAVECGGSDERDCLD
jgi:hypothetical protein